MSTVILNLTPELESRLTEEAERRGISVPELSLELLQRGLPPNPRNAEAIKLLQQWITEGDAEEQRETGEYLIRVLDGDRLSDRKLFPSELKGISW